MPEALQLLERPEALPAEVEIPSAEALQAMFDGDVAETPEAATDDVNTQYAKTSGTDDTKWTGKS